MTKNPMDAKIWKRGGRQQVLRTYLKLHEQEKLGEHWLWAVLERVAAGEKEDDVLADYGYMWARPIVHNASLEGCGAEGGASLSKRLLGTDDERNCDVE